MNLYFDNASTSFPKPPEVGEFINNYLSQGGTYGRAAYPRAFEASRMVEETRFLLSKLIGTSLTDNVIFTINSTSALNTLIQGFRYNHGKILISPLEHNAVVRPVEHMRESQGVNYQILPHHEDGLIDIDKLSSLNLSNIDLVIVNHVSNVNGLIQPIKEVKSIIGDIPIIVDASQSLGKVPIFADEWGIDMLVFTGHKGLNGPTGVGGFLIRDPKLVRPLIYGGTGSNSEKFVLPDFCPDRFEAGTQNIVGIYGLLGALKNQPNIHYSINTYHSIICRIKELSDIKLLLANDLYNQSDVFSISPNSVEVSTFTKLLYDVHKIEVRGGLHCSPLAHKVLDTFPKGAVRFSLSNYHTDNDLNHLLSCIIDVHEQLLFK